MKQRVESLDVHIDGLSTTGEGIGRLVSEKPRKEEASSKSRKGGQGRVVFVPRALPGEVWRVEVYQRHKNYLRGKAVKMLADASPDRQEAPCPFYESCGGCQIQHLAYEDQLESKRAWLQETFRRVGKLDVEVPPTVAGEPFAYRNRMAFDLGIEDRRSQALMHDPWTGLPRKPVDHCLLLEPELNDALAALRNALDGILERKTKPVERGFNRSRISVRRIGDGIYGVIQGFTLRKDQKEKLVNRLADGPFDGLYEVQNRSAFTAPRIRAYFERREPTLTDGNATVILSPIAFLQVNEPVAQRLYEHQAALPVREAPYALDMYTGMGILARRLGNRFERVIGVDRETASDGILNADDDIPEGVSLIQAEVEAALPALLERLGNELPVFLNPPRVGFNDIVRETLCDFRPRDVVIVSCHPAALARDAAALIEAGYEIHSAQPFDLFPQTHHLETVLHLQRA